MMQNKAFSPPPSFLSKCNRVGVGRVNGAKASGFDADRNKSENNTLFTGFPSKLENDGARRRMPPEGAGTTRRHSAGRLGSGRVKLHLRIESKTFFLRRWFLRSWFTGQVPLSAL